MRCRATAAATVVAALALAPTGAAHPQSTSSSPPADVVRARAPGAVTVSFSEDVSPVGEALTVVGPSGRVVSTGALLGTPRTLSRRVIARERGTYLVRWQVIGEDTHPARGAFLFSVGKRTSYGVPGQSRTGIVLQVVARWLSIAGVALGFGVPFVVLVALGAAVTDAHWRLVSLGISSMLVAEPIGLIGQTATLAPGSPFDLGVAGDVLRTSYGHTAGLRIGLAIGLWALMGATRQVGRRGLVAIAGLGVVACVVEADSLHRIGTLPEAVGLAIGAAHVAGAVVWLACIVLAVRGAPASRLARTAVGALLVAALSGSALALGHLERPSDVFSVAYGITLAAKTVLVAAAVWLGALAARRPGSRRIELATAAAILALGATLATTVPPL